MSKVPTAEEREAAERKADELEARQAQVEAPIDFVTFVLSLGSTIIWETSGGAALQIDIFAQLHLLQDRTHDIPRVANAAGEDGATNMVTSGFVGVAGWGLTFEW